MADNYHIVFAGGGTAGHLFPGLAVAHQLRRMLPTLKITFVGTSKAFERQYVRSAGFEHVAIACRPLPRGPLEAWRFVADNISGFYAAGRLVRERHVSLVVGLGGYASVPMARAAMSHKLPVVLLEQNAVPGRATRWLAASATLVCAAMNEVRPYLTRGCRLRITGNPLHRDFSDLVRSDLHPARLQRPRRLLVLGGSGGAKSLNEQVPLAIYKAGAAVANWQIVHQTGQHQAATTAELYRKLGLSARIVPFVDGMASVLAETDLAISRAGGTTLAELAAAGIPAILLPYPRATDEHQLRNAEVFVATGGCVLVDESDTSSRLDDRLSAALLSLVADGQLRLKMSQAMIRVARPEAAATVAEAITSVLAGAKQVHSENAHVDAA